MNMQPILEDDLIISRPLCKDDYKALYEVARDPLIWEQHPCKDRYKKEIYSNFFIESINSKGTFVIIEKSNNKVIGSTRFKKVINVENAIEIGWSFLSRDKWGGKYNKAMKNLMINYAFEFMDYVIFYIGKDNFRSQRAVQKIGGERIVSSHLKHLIKESETDWTYQINKENWKIKLKQAAGNG
ncbi:MAG: GNAT family N-acetyltransferase [Maribacter sp.]|nr:GNAT family N-acetyltransferase [Maribacter sp.]